MSQQKPNPNHVQATVETFSAVTGNGSALTDAGVRWNFSFSALSPTIRHLRTGQRVRLQVGPPHEFAGHAADSTTPSPSPARVISVKLLSVG